MSWHGRGADPRQHVSVAHGATGQVQSTSPAMPRTRAIAGSSRRTMRESETVQLKDWLVPLLVAIIAALATVLTAYVSGLRERRNRRANVLKDLEIVEKLPDGVAKRALTDSIQDRAFDVVNEARIARFNRREFYDYLLIIALVSVSPLSAVTGAPWWALEIAVIVGLGLVLLGNWGYQHGRERLQKTLIDEAVKRYGPTSSRPDQSTTDVG